VSILRIGGIAPQYFPVPYNPLTDPAVIAWFTADASATVVEAKNSYAISLGASPATYSATGMNGNPGVVHAVSTPVTCSAVGAAIATKSKVLVMASMLDNLKGGALSIFMEYAGAGGTGVGTLAMLRNDNGVDFSTEMWDSGSLAEYSITKANAIDLQFPKVMTFGGDMSVTTNNPYQARINGSLLNSSRNFTSTFTPGTFGNFTFSIGARANAGSKWNGAWRDILVLDAGNLSDQQRQIREQWMASRVVTGFLPVPDGFYLMPLGDSNCEGRPNSSIDIPGCWRNLLAGMFGALPGMTHVQSIGGHNENLPANPLWNKHNGIGGYSMQTARGDVATWAATVFQSNMVVLSLGTNDASIARPAASYIADTQAIVGAFQAANPRMGFIFMGVPFRSDGSESSAATLNATWASTLLPGFDTAAVPYRWVDTRAIITSWNGTDMDDFAHYNAVGHGKIANGNNGSPGMIQQVKALMDVMPNY
jgi:hypothetical protein